MDVERQIRFHGNPRTMLKVTPKLHDFQRGPKFEGDLMGVSKESEDRWIT